MEVIVSVDGVESTIVFVDHSNGDVEVDSSTSKLQTNLKILAGGPNRELLPCLMFPGGDGCG